MHAATQRVSVRNSTTWAATILSTLAILFLVFDGVIKVLQLAPVVESFTLLGYPTHLAVAIGLVELACIAVYLLPRTSILGAILLTGYLGGAISTHVRVESELFSLIFPIIIAAMLWGGLWLRDGRVRALLAART